MAAGDDADEYPGHDCCDYRDSQQRAGTGAVRLQQRVQSGYLWSHQARRYLALYERLLSGPKR